MSPIQDDIFTRYQEAMFPDVLHLLEEEKDPLLLLFDRLQEELENSEMLTEAAEVFFQSSFFFPLKYYDDDLYYTNRSHWKEKKILKAKKVLTLSKKYVLILSVP